MVPELVKDDVYYKVIFSDTSFLHLDTSPSYTVIRDTLPDDPASLPETLLTHINLINIEDETPLFDGLVLYFYNESPSVYVDSLSGWLVKNNNHEIEVGYDPMFTSETNPIFNLNTPYPSDLKLIFYDSIVTASIALLGSFKAIPTNFSLWNITDDSIPQPFLFEDNDDDSLFTMGDAIITLIEDPSSIVNYRTSWELSLLGPFTYDTTFYEDSIVIDTILIEDPVSPQPGDIFYLRNTKPFRGDWQNSEGDTLRGDIFEFVVKGESYSKEKAIDELDRIAVVPNPYVVTAAWESFNPYQFGRGERKLDFIHLPQNCIIRIYTVRGNLVKTIEHESDWKDGSESWNLVTHDGMDVAYGLYIYHIDAPGIGEKIGKFAVIK